jgi:membrane protease YdiL (CAAX protease family)
VGSFGPTLAAFALHYREKGWLGVRELLRRVRFRIKVGVLAFIIVAPLIQSWLAHRMSGNALVVLDSLHLMGTFVLYFFMGGPCGEEFGWRGYALERLQPHYGGLTSSLLIGETSGHSGISR